MANEIKYDKGDVILFKLLENNEMIESEVLGHTVFPSGSVVYKVYSEKYDESYLVYQDSVIKQIHKNEFNKQKQKLKL